ncbi:YCF48-related protein [Kitasatospora mediocidica]|uniref:YCF48-related protein n=1 Tax=Kitasatospora mediocidica TaxID=58352 RepID=UPI001E34C2AA|nr:YCF48-related protein [Kitasatospora mediocidica]
MRAITASAAAAALVLSAAACSSGHGSRTDPSPGLFNHLDATSWISPDTGWLLVTRPCGQDGCEALLHTTDAGHSWTRVYMNKEKDGEQTSVWLANASAGYVADYTGPPHGTTLATSDGGRTWNAPPDAAQPSGAVQTLDLASQGGTVLRAAHQNDPACSNTGDCGDEIQMATTGSDTWHTVLPPLSHSASYGQVVWQNDHVAYGAFLSAVVGPDSHIASFIYRSADAGKSWEPIPDPCDSRRGIAGRLATGPGDRLAVLCSGIDDSLYKFVATSTDNGKTWGAPRSLPEHGGITTAVALTGSTMIAVTKSTVWTSTDDGTSWQPVEALQADFSDSAFGLYGFNGSDIGEIVNHQGNTMWTTSDGGQNWSQLNVSAG